MSKQAKLVSVNIPYDEAIAFLHGYFLRYNEMHLEHQPAVTDDILNDALYGICAAINSEYRDADGYRGFKVALRVWLNREIQTETQPQPDDLSLIHI